MDLVQSEPLFNLYDDTWPTHRRHQPGPPAKTICYPPDRIARVEDSLLGTGVIVSGASVVRSILGPRCFLHSWSSVEDSILFDDVEVGRHCRIRKAIIDKHVKLPAGTVVGYDEEADRQRFTVTEEGIVVIPKGLAIAG